MNLWTRYDSGAKTDKPDIIVELVIQTNHLVAFSTTKLADLISCEPRNLI